VLLSNEATAVVLTPAVHAVVRAAKAGVPLPYLLACAFIANAASFVLPISNPANLVVFQDRLPALGEWLARFALPSLLAIMGTWFALRWRERGALAQPISAAIEVPPLAREGRLVAWIVGLSALALVATSAMGRDLGLVTALAAALGWLALACAKRAPPWAALAHVSWSVLPLVAGLFVLVEAIARTGALAALAALVSHAAAAAPAGTAFSTGLVTALACNVFNNLPVGLFAGALVASDAGLPQGVANALLIAIDLGPNLSITGSLATILWLVALRREGVEVGFADFLRVGLAVMPAALLPALGIAFTG
jgi:arsenical pump membrane protein